MIKDQNILNFDEDVLLDLYNEEVKFSIKDLQYSIEQYMKTIETRERQAKFINFLNYEFKKMEKEGQVRSLYVSSKVYAILRTLGKEFFEESSMSDIMDRGIYGKLWSAEIIVLPDLEGKVILSTESYIKEKNNG